MDLFNDKEIKATENKSSKTKTGLKLFGYGVLSLVLALITVIISAL